MPINTSQNRVSHDFTAQASDDIDLRQIIESLLRHKKLIVKITALTLTLSTLYIIIRKPVWEGRFQIVLERQDSDSAGRLANLAAGNPILANLAELGTGKGSQLETEVKVLESPSVLKPTYEFVKVNKIKAGENINNWTFLDWRKENLQIELEKGTSVLNISYRDTDPDLVLTVIKRISHDYQIYSGRDRKRGLSQGVDYLKKQVTELSEQSNISMRQAQSFALINGLGLQDGIPAVGAGTTKASQAASVEASREATQNRVNALEQQVASAKSAGNRSVFQAPQLKANEKLFDKLQTLEAELLHKQTLLKPNDDSIRRLNRRRQNLIAYINQQTIGLLEGELVVAQSQLTSLSRPRNVVLKHRELMRKALRDERTLTELETQLQTLQLEQARQTDPWELISVPTLLDKPVAPRKITITALALLSGIVVGSCTALVVDRRSGLIFSKDELINLLPCPLIKELPAIDQDTWTDAADLLASGPLSELSENSAIALIPLGKIPNDQIQAFSSELTRALKSRKLIVSTDLRETSNCATQLLITGLGTTTRIQLSEFCQKLALQGSPLTGWILLDPELDLG